ncbi:unnamed protein product [Heterobilharzia americana]|nr:unnamed protein product [Heterobilharzia americana]
MKFTILVIFCLTIILHSCFSQKLVGGVHPVDDAQTKKMKPIVKIAVMEYNYRTNSRYWFTDYDVKNMKTQIVSGALYHFTLHMKQTTCSKKNVMQSLKQGNDVHCKVDHSVDGQICEVEVWLKPWDKTQYHTEFTKCWAGKPSSKKPQEGGKQRNDHKPILPKKH